MITMDFLVGFVGGGLLGAISGGVFDYYAHKKCKHERLKLKESKEIYDSNFELVSERTFKCISCGKNITEVLK